MKSGVRRFIVLFAVALSAITFVLPGAAPAHAETQYLCSAVGTLDQYLDFETGGLQFWHWESNAAGTCRAGGRVVDMALSLHQTYLFQVPGSQHCDPPVGTTWPPELDGRLTFATGEFFQQRWTYQTPNFSVVQINSLSYIGHTPEPGPIVGAGIALHHILLGCPGEPKVYYEFSFTG
jgi:hypothetical protein